VLIDSRTGLTDIGSITTIVLPDRLAVVFTPNEQSLHGGIEVARQAMQMKANLSPESLPVFPLLARLDIGDSDKRLEWLKKIASRWSELFRDACGWPELDWFSYFEGVNIPYNASFSYGERIAVTDVLKNRGGGTLAQAYTSFTAALEHDTLASWFSTTKPTLEPRHDRALLIAYDADFDPPQRFSFESVVHVPAQSSAEKRDALRKPDHPNAWKDAATEIDRAIKAAVEGLRGNLHVFVMAPYAAAVLVGRFLDAYGRAISIHVHQFDAIMRDWVAFSVPSFGNVTIDNEPWFDHAEPTEIQATGKCIIVAIEGTRQLSQVTLTGLASQLKAREIILLRQHNPFPMTSFAQARRAVSALRQTLENLQSKHPKFTLHIVTTAPVAMMVELGRMLSSSVYGSVVVHQYEPQTDSYFPILDVMKPFEPANISRTKSIPAKKTPKKKS
jgi:hypothetical protein